MIGIGIGIGDARGAEAETAIEIGRGVEVVAVDGSQGGNDKVLLLCTIIYDTSGLLANRCPTSETIPNGNDKITSGYCLMYAYCPLLTFHCRS